ncbi:MAG: hypothetical protein ACJAZX_000474 [Rickettsiales bacterium]|jgi:hypothetical protein
MPLEPNNLETNTLLTPLLEKKDYFLLIGMEQFKIAAKIKTKKLSPLSALN